MMDNLMGPYKYRLFSMVRLAHMDAFQQKTGTYNQGRSQNLFYNLQSGHLAFIPAGFPAPFNTEDFVN
jgi:hypothetical protein